MESSVKKSVDVVVPVYNGYQETKDCLDSVLATLEGAPWARVIIVNDCSPDQKITAYLRELKSDTVPIILLENEENVGFVASVNRGMSFDDERDVLLLNSDVEVAGDWLSRLQEAAYYHENVASVTPFSNNATICSFPNICQDNQLIFGLTVEEIDAVFAAEFGVDDVFDVPTGIGFCMYLTRSYLNKVGLFDLEAFGRGYGEENDWCQRAIKQGGRNLHLANCFVYHKGGVSFGDEYSPRLAVALDTLDKRYPQYHTDIQRFIAEDPAKWVRMWGWLSLVSVQVKPKILLVCHKLGGGVRQHVEELARNLGDRVCFFLLIPERDGESIRVSCFDDGKLLKDSLVFRVEDEYEKIVDLMRDIGIGRLHFHHTMGLPTRIWSLAEDLGCEYDLTVHDYYLVNGNPALADKDGLYVSEDSPGFDERCAVTRPLPEGVTGSIWRANQRQMVEGAARVIFPSLDCANRFKKFFEVKRPVIAWHGDYSHQIPCPVSRGPFPKDRPLRVVVLGALSKEKGADVLEAVAESLPKELFEFHLLGYAYRKLGSNIISHGPYENENVDHLISEIDPDVIWFPALWPETYSYTLSIALRNSRPLVVPNIGAFGERVVGRSQTAVVNWDLSPTQWQEFWMDVRANGALPQCSDEGKGDCQEVLTEFYGAEYLQGVEGVKGVLGGGIGSVHNVFRNLNDNISSHSFDLTLPERFLKRIWLLSQAPAIAKLTSMVPINTQRKIKRSLSQRPIHEIMSAHN